MNGKEALVTKRNPNLERLKPAEFATLDDKQKLQVAKMFMGAVLTKNWDVVGLEHDNIVRDKTTGDMVEVDTGGAMEFRAMGTHKDYGEDIAEYASLKNTQYPAGQVFAPLFKNNPGLEQKALRAVQNLDMKRICGIFVKSGITNQADLFHSFKKRRQALMVQGVCQFRHGGLLCGFVSIMLSYRRFRTRRTQPF